MDLVIRPGETWDVSGVVALQDAATELSPWTPEALAAVLSGDSPYRMIVAELGTKLVGFLMWRELPVDEIELLSLTVEPGFRRRGIASALLGKMLAHGSGTCFLEVRKSNVAARALYRRFGFSESGLRPAYYHRPVEDAVVMRRPETRPKEETDTR